MQINMMRVALSAAVAGLVTVFFLSGGVLAQDSAVGTWTLNVAKSTYSPGPAPKSQTLKIEAVAGGAQKDTFDGVNAQGETTHMETVRKFDGQEVTPQAVQPAPTAVRTVAFKQVDDHSFEVVGRVAGKVTDTTRMAVSRDGKTLTMTTTGQNAQGQTLNNTAVYEKQ